MHFIINTIIKFVRLLSIVMSDNCRTGFAKFLSWILLHLIPKRLQITIDNLKYAYPDKSDDWLKKTAKATFVSLATTYLEALALVKMSEAEIKNKIKFSNPELIIQLHSKGKGLILLSGHFGNWELIAYAGGLYSGLQIVIPVVEQKYGGDILNASREAGGNKTIPKNKAARELMKTILSGSCIAMLADQSADKDKDLFVDFFGRPAVTYRAPADIALKYSVPIVMGFAVRQNDGTYKVDLAELKHDDLDYSEANVKELTQRHVKVLEDNIKEYPEQWAWMHRRWKHEVNS
jgi:KDO2-lipid IV(A) lauroyltransferase